MTYSVLSAIILLYSASAEYLNTVVSTRKDKTMQENMTRLELLTVMLSIKALLESDNTEKAKELIDEVIKEAKRKNNDN